MICKLKSELFFILLGQIHYLVHILRTSFLHFEQSQQRNFPLFIGEINYIVPSFLYFITMQNANMDMSIFVFYSQKKGIPSENPFLFRKELYMIITIFIFVMICFEYLSGMATDFHIQSFSFLLRL